MAKDHRKVSAQIAQGILLEDPDFLREIVERVLQEMLEAEMTEHVGAAPYERSATRTGHRNGHKPRTLRTRVGTLNLLVPQDREGTFSTRLFSRYQRNEKALVLALMEMYVEGVSTRKVKEITEELCGTSFSKSLVSSLGGSLDTELEAWRSRRLEAQAYPYVFVDARYEKVRVDTRVVSQGVLGVSAVRDDGLREILGVEVADTEMGSTYHELFRSLKARGLKGVELVVPDDHEGLKAAVSLATSGGLAGSGARSTTRGTCSGWWAPRGSRSWRRACGACSPPPSGDGAGAGLRAGRSVAREPPQGRRARRGAHRAVPHVPRLPGGPPPGIRTTNGPERLNQQIKRRTRVVRIFQPGVVPEAGNGVGRRAIGGVADGEALPGDGGAARAPWFRGAGGRGGETHGAMSVLILGGNYRAFGT